MAALTLPGGLVIDDAALEWKAIRAQGSGGQNVNKVSSALHLRFHVSSAGLPPSVQARLLALSDQRITEEGVLVIKAQQYRSQEQNREDALSRLEAIIRAAMYVPAQRRATAPSRSARRKRTDQKTHRGQIKSLRGRVRD